jgi:hypothetical protein
MKTLLLLILAGAARVLAMSGTDQLVGEYDPIEKRPHWPKGVYQLLLDPARKVGWKSWFSECPNDVEQYAFAARTTADAQRLIDALAKVDTKRRVVVLDPGHGPKGLGQWQPRAKGREWGAQLSFGNDAALRRWYERLKIGKDGHRHFGVSVLEKAPEAMPPTITFYLGTATIDPAALGIPKNISVEIRKSSQWPGRDYERQVEKLQALEAARGKGPQ